MPHESLPVNWVAPKIIRDIFNEGKFYERMIQGEFITTIKRSSHPNTPPDGEPYCTKSQILFYIDHNNNLVAVVHQYLRFNGKLGASGLPDPKRLFLDDKILAVRSEIKKP